MGFSEKNLGQTQIDTGSPTTVYTVPASTTTIVRDIVVCNTTGTNRTVELWIDPDGTGVTDSEAIISGVAVEANDFIHLAGFWLVMEAGGTIKAQASAGSALTITVSGAELT